MGKIKDFYAGLSKAQKGGAVISAALVAIFAVEGGFVNDPNDPGGATNYGITEKVARQYGYKGDMRDFPKYCTDGQAVCAESIYRSIYMEKPGFTKLVPVAPPVFKELADTGVNMGPAVASGFFYGALNTHCKTKFKVRPTISDEAVSAYKTCASNTGEVTLCVTMLNTLDAAQTRRYDFLISRNPKLRKFRKGWINHRIGNVKRKECNG